MKFSLDYCEHRASHAGLGASDSLIIPNGRIMDKNCLRPVCVIGQWGVRRTGSRGT